MKAIENSGLHGGMHAMTEKACTGAVGRRGFLGAMAGVSAAAAALVGAGAVTPAAAQESEEEMVKARYQPDSPDVLAYYETNRY
jgi:hypothetical protein